jgi:hypothetical protein
MAYGSHNLRQSAIVTLAELQTILSNISHDEERWAATLHWPIDSAETWWCGESVFVSHTYCQPTDHLVKGICFRFPAFPGDHFDDSATCVCLNPGLADLVWTAQLSPEEKRGFDVHEAFYRLWKPVVLQLSIFNCSLHSGHRPLQECS